MSKKLLGDRTVGDVEYKKDQVISDEEATTNGFTAEDVKDHSETAAPAEEATKEEDKDAELDSSSDSEQKKNQEDGASSESTGEPKTIPHTITQEDLDANPELVSEGVKVGDEVRLPAKEVTITEDMLAAHPEWAEKGAVVGGIMLVADDTEEAK